MHCYYLYLLHFSVLGYIYFLLILELFWDAFKIFAHVFYMHLYVFGFEIFVHVFSMELYVFVFKIFARVFSMRLYVFVFDSLFVFEICVHLTLCIPRWDDVC